MGNLMAHFHFNNHAQYEASRSMPNSIAVTEHSRNDYSDMVTRTAAAAEVAFLFTIVDKKPILGSLIIGGLVYSHGPTPLMRISEDWMQVLLAGCVISNISSIILADFASYFKEIRSPDHPGFVVCSMIVFWELLFFLLLICIILLGFERSSKCVIWSVGVFLLLSMVLVWVAFQRQPMIVWLKWTKNAPEWMLKWAKNAFEWMRAKISEWRLRDRSLPQICTEV